MRKYKLFDTNGKEVVESSEYNLDEFIEDSPTNGETSKAPSANWAYDHGSATTGVHGITGTVASKSKATTPLYVNKEATGAGTGSSYDDGFTTIQAAIDALPDILVNSYTIYVRHGTKATGTADEYSQWRLHDTGAFPSSTTWAGRRVFRSSGTLVGDKWGVVASRVNDDELSIVDWSTGSSYDLFPAGNENYVIEPTPYREKVSVKLPITAAQLYIRGEYYWYASCDEHATTGEIYDSGANFDNVEVGDRVLVMDFNGADGRVQDYDIGTVTSISQAGDDIIATNIPIEPTTGWKYLIVKTEISGSDNGTDPGTARDACFEYDKQQRATYLRGFYMTLTDANVINVVSGVNPLYIQYNFVEHCDRGPRIYDGSIADFMYGYCEADLYAFEVSRLSYMSGYECVLKSASHATYDDLNSFIILNYFYIDNANRAANLDEGSTIRLFRGTISANVTTGIYARSGSYYNSAYLTNSATTPIDTDSLLAIDEDDMASNSDLYVPTQQSVVAYAATHAAAADPHAGYRLESADHTHQTTGAQAGKIDHGLALDGLTDDDHTQYIKHALATVANDVLMASGAGVFVKQTLAQLKTALAITSDIATHAALTATHGVAGTIASVANIATHAAFGLSSTIHPNTSFCEVRPSADQDNLETGIYTRIALDTVVSGANFVGAAGEKHYDQALSTGGSSTSIIMTGAGFTNAKCRYARVTWSSDAGGTLNVGAGYVTVVASDTLTIDKTPAAGADFASGYYFTIKKSHYLVPVTGIYLISGLILWVGAAVEAAKIYQPILLVNGLVGLLPAYHSGVAANIIAPTFSYIAQLTAGHPVSLAQRHTATANQTVGYFYTKMQVTLLYEV
uniref:Uncharacterized protein n=1 Tax=viral metagenome TaxID=1070528 RepID=A0A6M3L335_9ZZZZ